MPRPRIAGVFQPPRGFESTLPGIGGSVNHTGSTSRKFQEARATCVGQFVHLNDTSIRIS